MMSVSNLASGQSSAAPEPQPFQVHMGRVSRHSAVFFLGTIFSAVTAYGFKIYLARVLGARALGIYALGMTIVGFVSIFNALGLPHAATRFVPAYCATGKIELLRGFLVKSVRILLLFNFILAMAVWLAGPWVAVRFYHTPELKPYMGLFAVIMLLGVLTMFCGHVLVGYKDVARRTVIVNFIGGPLVMLLVVALIGLGMGLRGYILAQAVNAVIVLALMAASVWRRTPAAARSFTLPAGPLQKDVISFSVAALGLALLQFFMSHTDSVAIGYYLPAHELGIYAVASAVVTFASIVLRSVTEIFAPFISDLHSSHQLELLGRMFQTITKWVVGFTVPLAAVMVLFAVPLMRIFGRDFEVGWPVLVIGAVGQMINCGVGPAGTMLFMSGNQKSLVRIQVVTASLMVLLNLLLVPRWGIVGAAAAAAITVGATNFAYLYRVWRSLGLSPYNRSYARLILPLLGSVGLLLVLKSVGGDMHPQWLVIGIGLALSYLAFIALAFAFGLDADDRIILRTLWARMPFVSPRLEANTSDD